MATVSKTTLIRGGSLLAVLGVLSLPLTAAAAANTANTTINATVATSISITTLGTVGMTITPAGTGAVSSASDTVTVSTNNATGYNLKLSNADATTTLLSGGGGTFAAHAGTFAAPTALAADTWGYAVAGGNFDASYAAESSSTTSTSKWAGVPALASPQTLKTTASVASGDTTTVWYAAKASAGKTPGLYTDTVTYTATTNP